MFILGQGFSKKNVIVRLLQNIVQNLLYNSFYVNYFDLTDLESRKYLTRKFSKVPLTIEAGDGCQWGGCETHDHVRQVNVADKHVDTSVKTRGPGNIYVLMTMSD